MSARTATASTAVAALLGGCVLLSAGQTQAAGAGDTPVVYAHRGASAYAPENTLAAVDAADDLGISWVENDVQRTADGVLVVMHDTTLARTTDAEQVYPDRAPWAVKDFTAAEIAKLDAGSWFGAEFTGARVPTLKSYLQRVERNRQKLLLEIKSPATYPGIEKEILRVLRQEGWLDRGHVKHRLVVQSFGAESVKIVHEQRPDVVTGFLGTPAVADLPAYAAFTDQINPSYTTIDADYVAEVQKLKGAHGKPLRVNTWTVNDAEKAARVAGYGVDGIISNNPDLVRDATR
ncbi:glycerophosphodiester phosphodiesterase [Streptomyces nitrosporeus]|uniref:Glycerophosphodiester phosphodiesterase n=1 Tax=Streptomyces nitrosporeus TaxID=28894 RepID=A0A5J6FET2_9ACTN|nr:glycerophosphodiester phosphodiesterase family protein [Streptomyces nitrosporeus]QEU75029.1 glycerophosphodiester phosphodiesterase [Streptomyces nitrosporeus]GGY91529.1 hydrolase [Streptomyces nitrosporeus]